ncbi:MAG TPA: ATP-dependent helicase [Spirochaetia bacterium]|nr:MAG: helicase [Spirochaetes bacterium GWB1_36_13]HCL56740.1 ATP-dependent helicase [Spirochaetia bacterium]
MNDTFEKLGVNPLLCEGLSKASILNPTPVQKEVIPSALSGKDLIGESDTGTGKTLAYLLPLFQKIDPEKKENQALILAPTHELASQIQREIEKLALNSGVPVKSALIIGGVNLSRQIEKLKEKPQIVTGSLERILELIQKKKISAHTVKTIIIDEADRLLDSNLYRSIQTLVKTTLKDRQIMTFSATMTEKAITMGKELMKEPFIVKLTGKTEVSPDIDHFYFFAEFRERIEVLRKIIKTIGNERALLFINKSDDIEVIAGKLNFFGIKAAGLYSTLGKNERKKTLDDFRNDKIQILVATDIAARGLDIQGIGYVFNFDIPKDPEIYLHRAGRTGRNGAKGTVMTTITAKELPLVEKYQNKLKIQMIEKKIFKGKIVEKDFFEN